jgi:hypothetical protein
MTKRYFLSQDHAYCWRIVPVSRRCEWEAWQELQENDERYWAAPDFAKPVGASLSAMTFESPVTEAPEAQKTSQTQ